MAVYVAVRSTPSWRVGTLFVGDEEEVMVGERVPTGKVTYKVRPKSRITIPFNTIRTFVVEIKMQVEE